MRRRVFLSALGTAAIGGLELAATAVPARLGSRRLGRRLEAIHAAGVTGDGVTVGVVDPAGFDADDPAIADAVRAARAFGAGRRGRRRHGTAAAAAVRRIAPDAALLLARYADGDGYRAALDWLAGRVDVVAVPASFYGQPDDGGSPVATATADLAEVAVVVAAAGNLARRHWRTRLDAEGRPRADPPRVRVTGTERVALWLAVHAGPADAGAYRLALVPRDRPGVAATGDPYPADPVPNRRLAATVFPGTYRVEVRGPPGAVVDVTAVSHRLRGGVAAGSVAAPATGAGVLGVGAYEPARGPAAYSSRGPPDAAAGVDLTAPARVRTAATGFNGSSAAAAVAAGAAALGAGVGNHAPGRLRAAMLATARDVAAGGPDAATGHGVVAPVRLIRRLGGPDVASPGGGKS